MKNPPTKTINEMNNFWGNEVPSGVNCQLDLELQIGSLHEGSSALGRPVNHQAFTQSQRTLLLTHQVKKNLVLGEIISLVCLMFYGVTQCLFTSPQENKHNKLSMPVFLCPALNTFNTGLETNLSNVMKQIPVLPNKGRHNKKPGTPVFLLCLSFLENESESCSKPYTGVDCGSEDLMGNLST